MDTYNTKQETPKAKKEEERSVADLEVLNALTEDESENIETV
jgi:hypothetical protein